MDENTNNINSPFMLRDWTTKRLSILKPFDATELRDDEDDTKIRKSKRVSFSARIQIKTIDESINDQAHSKLDRNPLALKNTMEMNDSIIPSTEQSKADGSSMMDTMNDTTFRDLEESKYSILAHSMTLNETINDTLRVSMLTSVIEQESNLNLEETVEDKEPKIISEKENISNISKSLTDKIIKEPQQKKFIMFDEEINKKSIKDKESKKNNEHIDFISKKLNDVNKNKNTETLKIRFREGLEKLKKLNEILKQNHEQNTKEQNEFKECLSKIKSENATLKKKLQTAQANILKEKHITNINNINENLNDKENVLKKLTNQNQNLSKLNEKNTNVLDKNFNTLNKIRETREQYENISQYNKMFPNILKDYNAQFKLVNFTNDSITLGYFFDLIEIEIQAHNIASFKTETTQRPIKDSYINRITFRNKLPNNPQEHVKFCCKLIENDIDVRTINKKYRNVDDLPILINYLNFVCTCATNLCKDLEYLVVKYKKVDFNFENFTIKFNMYSILDLCYYELKLSLQPKLYYQEPIAFDIREVEDSFYKPNCQRLKKILEDKYLENGTLKDLLEALN